MLLRQKQPLRQADPSQSLLQAGTSISCISLAVCWPALPILKEDSRVQPRVTGLVFAVFPLTWKAELLLCSFKSVSKLREIKHSALLSEAAAF